MLYSTLIDLSDSFPEFREFSHSKTHSAKQFIPRFEDKSWTSILFIERGNFQIRYETGEILKARGGTFYYHPPLALKYHTEDNTISPYSMYHLAVKLSTDKNGLFTSRIAKQQIVTQFPDHPFIRNAPAVMIESFKTIVKEYEEKEAGYLAQIENSLRQILLSAVRSENCYEQHSHAQRKYMKTVDAFLEGHVDFMGPVEQLFELMGVSRSHGYEIFHEAFGITPKDYILRRKIMLAKKLLHAGNDITDIAFSLGFSSSQNFATVFKKLTCLTPSQFRRKA